MTKRDSDEPEITRAEGGKFAPGQTGNAGGRPKRLIEIEVMLNAKHRTPEMVDQAMRAAFDFGCRGGKGDSAYLALWLNRALGPVKELIPEDWLADAPEAVLEWLRRRN